MKQYDVLKPACYNGFSCKGGACRNTCCCEWSITMTRDEYRNMKRKVPDIKEKIRLVEDSRRTKAEHYVMILDNDGFCPYLGADKLCSLQAQFGAEILTDICSVFPRTYHKYLDKLESSLSLGCERVLELLLAEKDGLEIIHLKELKEDHLQVNSSVDEISIRKSPVLPYYFDIQTLCLCLLQAEDACLEDRILLLGIAIHHIDELIRDKRAVEIPDYISEYLDKIDGFDITGQLRNVKAENIGVLYHNLSIATQYTGMNERHYADLVKQIQQKLKMTIELDKVPNGEGSQRCAQGDSEEVTRFQTLECSTEVYRSCQEQFRKFREDKEYFLENIMVAYLFYSNTPFMKGKDGVWENYTYFVWVYSMLKFSLTVLLEEDSTETDLIDCCVTLFRKLGHDRALYEEISHTFVKNESNSVAHMAVLLKS